MVPAAAGGQSAPAPERTDTALVLEIQRRMDVAASVDDPERRRATLIAQLRRVPPLAAELEERFPHSKYLAAGLSMAVDALVLRREAGDEKVSCKEIVAAAEKLADSADREDFQAKGRLVALRWSLRGDVLAARREWEKARSAASRPATASRPTATQPASRPAVCPAERKLRRAYARKAAALAARFPETLHAPVALHLAGSLHLAADEQAEAVKAFDRLTVNYPKDPLSLEALIALADLHRRAGRDEKALAAKRRCVDHFDRVADPELAMIVAQFKRDIALAECVGKPFFLRFASVDGERFNIGDHKGKTVLVYFVLSLVDGEYAAEDRASLAAMSKLAAQRGCVLAAVCADSREAAPKVLAAAKKAGLDVPILLDARSRVAAQYGVLTVPAVAVVGPKGKLREVIARDPIVEQVRTALTAPTATAPAGGDD
jgi:peroxiredoxin